MGCKKKMKFGGKVELEGGEAIHMNGAGGMVEGPDHEEGGVDMDLPQGTLVFSKRLKLGDKTMAEREMARLRKEKKAQKALEKQPTDPVNRFTLDRVLQLSDMERKMDLQVQQMYDSSDSKAVGMKNGGKVKYQTGTGPMGVLGNLNRLNLRDLPLQGEVPPVYNIFNSGFTPQQSVPQQVTTRTPQQMYANYSMDDLLGEDYMMPKSEATPKMSTDITEGNAAVPQAMLTNPINRLPDLPKEENGVGEFVKSAAGLALPALGPAGLAISAVAPLVTTVLNRLGDKKPVNQYEDFGREALESNAAAMRGASATKDQQQRQIDLEADKSRNVSRSSARGISTLRALEQGTSAQSMAAKTAANTQYYNNLANLFANRAQLQNARDQMVMQGRDVAAERATQDRDAFFTNINKALGTLGEGMMFGQKMSKTPNIWSAFDGFRVKKGG